jgi:hypothetical protein
LALELERVDPSVESAQLCRLLERDGAVIVEGILSSTQLQRLNQELDQHINTLAPGLRHPTHESMIEFFGHNTIRCDGLPGKSETFQEVMLLRQLIETADHFLRPNCNDYLLNTGQLIQIGAGETEQRLHRDEDAWRELPAPKPTLQIEAMFALTDFTVANGATRVVSGSHRWPHDRVPQANEITSAEMPAGSALVYLGSTIHGGGANTTTQESRRGMFLGFVVGWLRTEENTFLTVPLEKARTMPVRVQQLLGYKAHGSIGVVDVGDPMVVLQ